MEELPKTYDPKQVEGKTPPQFFQRYLVCKGIAAKRLPLRSALIKLYANGIRRIEAGQRLI